MRESCFKSTSFQNTDIVPVFLPCFTGYVRRLAQQYLTVAISSKFVHAPVASCLTGSNILFFQPWKGSLRMENMANMPR